MGAALLVGASGGDDDDDAACDEARGFVGQKGAAGTGGGGTVGSTAWPAEGDGGPC